MDKEKIKKAVYDILVAIGENPGRDGLKDTPERVANMYEEIFSGITSDANSHLKMFKESSLKSDIIVVKDIPVYSMCEHHLLPFIGVAHISYVPTEGNIIGLSKLSRIVDCYARRPQVQERLTSQVSEFLFSNMKVKGVGVIIKAEHLCMTMRGVKALGSKTITMSYKGSFESDLSLKREATEMMLGENNR